MCVHIYVRVHKCVSVNVSRSTCVSVFKTKTILVEYQ